MSIFKARCLVEESKFVVGETVWIDDKNGQFHMQKYPERGCLNHGPLCWYVNSDSFIRINKKTIVILRDNG